MARALPLPPEPHLPGRNARPSGGAVEEIAAAARGDDVAAREIAWRFGLRLLLEGYHWEAHEVLEPVWQRLPPNATTRLLVQGLIQLANASLKTELERPRAAARLREIAGDLLLEAARRGQSGVADRARAGWLAGALAGVVSRGEDWRPLIADTLCSESIILQDLEKAVTVGA